MTGHLSGMRIDEETNLLGEEKTFISDSHSSRSRSCNCSRTIWKRWFCISCNHVWNSVGHIVSSAIYSSDDRLRRNDEKASQHCVCGLDDSDFGRSGLVLDALARTMARLDDRGLDGLDTLEC